MTIPAAGAAKITPGRAQAWLLATRPKTLTAGVVPVAVGSGLAAADGVLRPWVALAALVGALLIQIGCNLANDLFDFVNGADGDDRLGPDRAAAQGWLSVRALAWGTALVFVAAAGIGVALTAVAGWPVTVIGVVSVLAAIGYTGGPVPLGYIGLGDVLVFIFFGVVAVCGTYFVQAGHVSAASVFAAVPVGCLATAILVVNNLRDRRSDARTGKRTLAVRLGERGARWEYFALVAASYIVLPLPPVMGVGSWGWLLPVISVPLALRTALRFAAADGGALNPLLGETARLGVVFGALLAVGVVL